MNPEKHLASLYKIGALAALGQLGTILVMVVATAAYGAQDLSAAAAFKVFQTNPLAGFLGKDFTSVVMIALYLGTFPALFAALKDVHLPYTALAALFTMLGVVVCFSTDATFSLLHLSQQHAAAASEAERLQYLAAGEAAIATNMWNSTGGYMSGMLLQGAGVLISAVMLRSRRFSKATAIAGLLGNGFDLAQHILHPFAPGLSGVLLGIAGPFYLAWFPLLAWDLFRLAAGRRAPARQAQPA